MNTKPLGESNTAIRLRTSLENVRSYLVDLEALAHAARETLDRLPYMPRSSGSEGPELEVRLNYGRLQTLVSATAASARDVLLACDRMLEESDEPPDDDADGGDGGPEEPPDDDGGPEEPPDDDDGGPEEPPVSSRATASPMSRALGTCRRPRSNTASSKSVSMTSTMGRG